jgi:hypothetical protein
LIFKLLFETFKLGKWDEHTHFLQCKKVSKIIFLSKAASSWWFVIATANQPSEPEHTYNLKYGGGNDRKFQIYRVSKKKISNLWIVTQHLFLISLKLWRQLNRWKPLKNCPKRWTKVIGGIPKPYSLDNWRNTRAWENGRKGNDYNKHTMSYVC